VGGVAEKIILGTANFGQQYGIIPNQAIDRQDSARKLLALAQKNSMRGIDTSRSYKNAEKLIGLNSDLLDGFEITTKLNLTDCASRDSVISSVRESLETMRVPILSKTLVHDTKILSSRDKSFAQGLEKAVELELTKQIGVSVYTKEEIQISYDNFPTFKNFQIPFSIANTKLLRTAHQIQKESYSISVRSIFLQGLLLLKVHQVPEYLNEAKPFISYIQKFADENEITVAQLCIEFVLHSLPLATIVIGVNSEEQLREIISMSQKKIRWDLFDPPPLAERITDPRFWKEF